MRIAIISNDDQVIQLLSKQVTEYSLKKLLVSKTIVFRSVKKFLNSEDEFDILFVDATLDMGSGIDSAKIIREELPRCTLAVISNNQSDVFEAFPIKAYRFLLKPLSIGMIDETLDSFRRDQFSDRYIIGKTKNGYNTFCMSEIVYVMADGKHSIVYLVDGEVGLMTPFSQIVDQLPKDTFFTCCRSFVVNMQFVQSFNTTDIILKSGEEVPLSRRRKMDFYIKYNEYVRSHTFN